MLNSIKWTEAIPHIKNTNESWVLATVIGTKGSTPRDSGSKMIITQKDTYDTIGGGRFEFQVITQARKMIEEIHSNVVEDIENFNDSLNSYNNSQQQLLNFPLAAKTNQCCGGHVSVLLECFSACMPSIHIFGAGHVAKALVPILKEMDYEINWIDSRDSLLANEDRSSKVRHYIYDDISKHIKVMSPNSTALVITHDHRLDYKLICDLLDRKDCRFIGLIGSKTKALRFKRRLRSDSFQQHEIDQVICPVGLSEVPGKKPIEIAISITAQLVQKLHHQDKNSGLTWMQLNNEIENISDTHDSKLARNSRVAIPKLSPRFETGNNED